MKKLWVWFFVFLLAVLSFQSCRLQPTAPETATIKGQVLLATDVYNDPAPPPYSGILVSLEGTNYSALTNDSGLYEFDGIPEGTYDVRFSKAGYGEIRWFGMMVQGGGNASIYWYNQQPQTFYAGVYPTLYKISDFVTTLQSVTLKDTINPDGSNQPVMTHWLSGQYSGANPVNHDIAVYFSHHSNVSSAPGYYEYFEGWWGSGQYNLWRPFDTLTGSFHIPIDFGIYRSNGFNSGDSVYVAAYGAPFWISPFSYYDYYDPSIRQGVLTSINQTPSPVVGFKIP